MQPGSKSAAQWRCEPSEVGRLLKAQIQEEERPPQRHQFLRGSWERPPRGTHACRWQRRHCGRSPGGLQATPLSSSPLLSRMRHQAAGTPRAVRAAEPRLRRSGGGPGRPWQSASARRRDRGIAGRCVTPCAAAQLLRCSQHCASRAQHHIPSLSHCGGQSTTPRASGNTVHDRSRNRFAVKCGGQSGRFARKVANVGHTQFFFGGLHILYVMYQQLRRTRVGRSRKAICRGHPSPLPSTHCAHTGRLFQLLTAHDPEGGLRAVSQRGAGKWCCAVRGCAEGERRHE